MADALTPPFENWDATIKLNLSAQPGLTKEVITERISQAMDKLQAELEDDRDGERNEYAGKIRLLDDKITAEVA